MRKMRTSELTGAALDLAVAKCEAVKVRWSAPHEQLLIEGKPYTVWNPHKNWAQGGAIIEREGLSLACRPKDARGVWCAVLGPNRFFSPDFEGYGITPLIAAMRCYVASKLGDEVQIPEALK